MKKVLSKKHSNQSGQVMTEFLFATIVSFGLFMLFFALTMTFAAVEVTQYAAYSTARAQVGGNKTPEDQKQAAISKYKSFLKNPAYGVFFQSGWFVLGKTPDIRQGGESGQTFTELYTATPDGNNFKVFMGASIPFESKLMAYKVMFIDSGKQNDSGFKTNVNGILAREPAQSECQSFWKDRAAALKQLPSGGAMKTGSYYPMEDNGC
jgi:hypothetical protein